MFFKPSPCLFLAHTHMHMQICIALVMERYYDNSLSLLKALLCKIPSPKTLNPSSRTVSVELLSFFLAHGDLKY